MMPDRVKQILSWYESENPGVLANLRRIIGTGTLADTGKFVILPVDQGVEHGPHRSFGPNPPAYNPHYHFELALEAGCNAYAAPLGFLEAGARTFAGELPLILKLNNNNSLYSDENPTQAITGSVEQALQIGASAIGFTIYPGSVHSTAMYEQAQALSEEAKRFGLAVVIWSYPRGEQISKDGETAMDVAAYAAQIACQLGANIVKVKLPSDKLEQDAARKVYEKESIPIKTQADRVRNVVQSSFDGRRIVIFSGGAKKGEDSLYEDARDIRDGGGFGSIIGRNAFQRPKKEAVAMLKKIMAIYAGKE